MTINGSTWIGRKGALRELSRGGFRGFAAINARLETRYDIDATYGYLARDALSFTASHAFLLGARLRSQKQKWIVVSIEAQRKKGTREGGARAVTAGCGSRGACFSGYQRRAAYETVSPPGSRGRLPWSFTGALF